MKNLFSRFGLSAIVCWMACAVCFAEESCDNDKKENRNIAITRQKQPKDPIRPRMPARQDITCMYEAAGQALVFEFFDDMGGIVITVANTATGETVGDFCPATPGTCRTALSGDSGCYTIHLEDARGRTYTGAFERNYSC